MPSLWQETGLDSLADLSNLPGRRPDEVRRPGDVGMRGVLEGLHRGGESPARCNQHAMKSFTIEINMSESLKVDQIWPDGNAPENPTVEDVKALFFKDRDVHRTCEDWGFQITKGDVTITDNNTDDFIRRLEEARQRIRDARNPEE